MITLAPSKLTWSFTDDQGKTRQALRRLISLMEKDNFLVTFTLARKMPATTRKRLDSS